MSSPDLITDEVWQRSSFSLAEQLKILLIFADGLPFRSTQRNYPNRLDVSEASELIQWPERHLHWLIHRALELGLIDSDDGRFFMTETVEDWEQGELNPPLEESSVPNHEQLANEVTEVEAGKKGRVFKAQNQLITKLHSLQAPQSISELLEVFDSDDTVYGSSSNSVNREAILRNRIRQAYDLGWVDVQLEEGTIREVQVNQRGERWLEGEEVADAGPEIDQSLPVILQPDGQLLVPLESPLEIFRCAHPFVLLTGIDNMVKYNMDQRSLVNAENEGWNTQAFYNFLEEETGNIPETVASLFRETDEEAERIRVEPVHHLLEFERGATAAEAMRVLSNYQPERIDEHRLILRSSTTPETIKKNLSRAGIRIQMDTNQSRAQSPLLPKPGKNLD